jgi:hypothetical protein
MKRTAQSHIICALHAALALLLLNATTAAADEAANGFEDLRELPVESVLPPGFLHSAHYSIEPVVRAKDNFYRFTVNTDHVTYEVTSTAMLRIRLYEIATIAELEPRLSASNITFNRSPGGRRGVGSERVVDILADPIGTASQLLGNIQYNVEQTFAERRDAETPGLRGSTEQDLNPGPHKRSAGAQLGVDVYSSNARLQRLLNAVADARSAGKTANSFSPLVRNNYAAEPFGSGVLNLRLDSHLKNSGSQDLNAEIEGTLRELDVPPRTRIAFLTHPAYTPRTRLYFTTYVSLLAPLKQVDLLFAAATAARTEADALAYVSYARMLAYYQLQGGDLIEVVTDARFPTLATGDGNAVLVLPLDYLAWTLAVAKAADALQEIRETRGLERFIVLLAGTPTARAKTELDRRAVEIRPSYSF